MTFLLSVAGHRAVWLLADRQLSRNGIPVKDDACKVFWLDTEDGQSILAYSGLGATASGRELSEWMGKVLRGRNLSLQDSVAALAKAMESQFPAHLDSSLSHHHLAVTSVLGNSTVLSSVDVVWDGHTHKAIIAKPEKQAAGQPPIIRFAGSGSPHVSAAQRTAINKVVRAYDRGKASDDEVMQVLIETNEAVAALEPTVSAACIVTSRLKPQGGGLRFHGRRQAEGEFVPQIGRGTDWGTFIKMLTPEMAKKTIGLLGKGPEYKADIEAIVDEFNRLPEDPEENLT